MSREGVRTEWWRPVVASARAAAPTGSAAGAAGSGVPFWALMAFTFILLLSPQSHFPALAPLRIALFAAALAAGTFVLDRLSRHQPVVTFTREAAIIGGLLAWSVLTLPLSYWPGGSVSFLVEVYLKTLVVFWLLAELITSVARLRLVAWGLSLMALPIAVSAFANLMSGNFLEQGYSSIESRIRGYDAPLTANPNDLALTLNLILPLAVGLLLASRRPAVRVALVACICLDAIAIVATFSRAGFLTLGVSFCAWLWALCRRNERSWAVLAVVLALAAVPFLPSGYVERLGTISNIEADTSGSAQERWADTRAAVGYVLGNPVVGAGIGMNILAMNEARPGGEAWKDIHNVYLQYAVELGIPGLALYLMLLKGALQNAGAALRASAGERAQQELHWLATGLRISLIAFAVAAFFHPVAYHFYFYYMAGLALAARRIGAPPEPVA